MADRAKEIFLIYNGNHSAMANDGIYEEYKSYGVSEEQEDIWRISFSDEVKKLAYSDNFRVDFVKACSYVRKSKKSDKLDELFYYLFSEKAEQCENSGKLQMADAFIDAVISVDKNLLKIKYLNQLNAFFVSVKNNSALSKEISRADLIMQRMINA